MALRRQRQARVATTMAMPPAKKRHRVIPSDRWTPATACPPWSRWSGARRRRGWRRGRGRRAWGRRRRRGDRRLPWGPPGRFSSGCGTPRSGPAQIPPEQDSLLKTTSKFSCFFGMFWQASQFGRSGYPFFTVYLSWTRHFSFLTFDKISTAMKIPSRYSQKRKLRSVSPNFYIHLDSCVCERFIYSHDVLPISAAGKYVDRSWEYINRSQTHECRNWDWGRAIPFLGIVVSNFRYCFFVFFMYVSAGPRLGPAQIPPE
jgi:hypothetical protein